MEPHFDWVLTELCKRPAKKMKFQVDQLVDQMLDRMGKEMKEKWAKEGIISLQ